MLGHNKYNISLTLLDKLRVNLYLSNYDINNIPKIKSITNLKNPIRPENKIKNKNDSHNPLSLTKRVILKSYRKYSYEGIDNIESSNKNYILEKIINERNNAANKIIYYFKRYYSLIIIKKREIINLIFSIRVESITKIQKYFRMYMVRKDITKMINVSDNYVYFYVIEKLNNKSPSNIQIKIFNSNKSNVLLNFSYSKVLDIYYTLLIKPKILKKKIRVNFIINDQIIIDHRFPVDFQNGQFYNILDTTNIFRRNNHISSNKWQRIFDINLSEKSISENSMTDRIDIDKAFKENMRINKLKYKSFPNNKPFKSIIKKTTNKKNKSVSFAKENQYFN